MADPPSTILIVGAGVFGLSTALALLKRPRYAGTNIIIVDAAKEIPNPSGSSVDSSRIIRADYSSPVYSKLAAEAQVLWRDRSTNGWGGEDRYFEPGFLLTVDSQEQTDYLKHAMENVTKMAEEPVRADESGRGRSVEMLEDQESIKRASGYDEAGGLCGYVNWGSGWADAARVVAWMTKRIRDEGQSRVHFMLGKKVDRVILERGKIVGVQIEDKQVLADLTVLAAGAWSSSLVDLRGRVVATGQALTYINISDEEEKSMADRPTIINMSRGMFIIPPRNGELKLARHGFGYRNPEKIATKNVLGCESENGEIEVSLPWNGIEVPKEGQDACKAMLHELLPRMGDRPFTHTRVCWYCDTPTGDFIIAWYPGYEGLYVATGGGGHGFKFAPVIGEKIVDGLEGSLDMELKESWRWRDPVSNFTGCDDGSRAGARGMILKDEMERSGTRLHKL